MKKPQYKRGNWRVIRWCCRSGNCFECRHMTGRKAVVHTDNVSEAWAKYVAHNWSAYDAKVERMLGRPEEVQHAG